MELEELFRREEGVIGEFADADVQVALPLRVVNYVMGVVATSVTEESEDRKKLLVADAIARLLPAAEAVYRPAMDERGLTAERARLLAEAGY